MAGPKILYLDIETTPNLVYTFDLRNIDVAPSQIVQPSRMLSFAAKFRGEKKVYFEHGEGMVDTVFGLLDEADIVCTFNGDRFDHPILHGEFLLEGMTRRPAPYISLDFYKITRKFFKFPSGRLGYLAEILGLEGKVSTGGFQLWIDCMAGDKNAWKKMKKYNIRDVTLLEEMHDLLLPWISNHPSVGLYSDEPYGCPTCGSKDVKPRGFSYTQRGKFQRYLCSACNTWSRDPRAIERGVLSLVP